MRNKIDNKIKDKYELPSLIEKHNEEFASLKEKNLKSKTLIFILPVPIDYL